MDFLSELTHKEHNRQQNTLNLIASENYPSPKVLRLLGSVWSNKYGEGYPGKRYYAGNVYTDELETFVQQKALQVFDPTGEYAVNVQVLSGSPANSTVYLSVLEAGDTIMSLNLDNGGHISHLHSTSPWLKFFKLINYDVKETAKDTFEMDLQDFEEKIQKYKPKLVIIGCSAYPRKYEFTKFCQIAHQNGALVLADIAHINGLVAANLHETPFKSGKDGADFVSMTTHKTFRGPRGAMLFFKQDLAKQVNKTIFPGTSGGPHFNKIAAIGQSCLEILGEEQYPDGIDFRTYSQNILDTCKSLENALADNGLEVVSPTENHLCLVRLPENSDSLEIQKKLEEIGIITNRNKIPFDAKTAWRPSGMRFGTAALASRGLSVETAGQVGKIITDCIFDIKNQEVLGKEVTEIVKNLKWWYN